MSDPGQASPETATSSQERIKELEAAITLLREQLRDAEEALQEERFKDVPRYPRGTVVLVPRKLFGQRTMWPARIDGVVFHYSEGADAKGVSYESKTVSYAVSYQLRDGSFGGPVMGAWHKDVMLRPAAQETPG